MIRLLVGVALGAALAIGGGTWWLARGGCFERCGDGTRCAAGICISALPKPAEPTSTTRDPRRTLRRPGGAAPEAKLAPGDEKMVAEGDALGRTEHIDLSDPDARELTEKDL